MNGTATTVRQALTLTVAGTSASNTAAIVLAVGRRTTSSVPYAPFWPCTSDNSWLEHRSVKQAPVHDGLALGGIVNAAAEEGKAVADMRTKPDPPPAPPPRAAPGPSIYGRLDVTVHDRDLRLSRRSGSE